MDVRKELMILGYNISELAVRLGISRRSLYNYFEQLKTNGKVSNFKFNFLFRKIIADIKYPERVEQHIRKFERDNNMITTNRRKKIDYNDFNIEHYHNIIQLMRRDFESGNYNKNVYEFIEILLNSYKHEEMFKDFIDYILILYSTKNHNLEDYNVSKQMFFAEMYNLTNNYSSGEMEFNPAKHNQFNHRLNVVDRLKSYKQSIYNKEINEKFNEVINNNFYKMKIPKN